MSKKRRTKKEKIRASERHEPLNTVSLPEIKETLSVIEKKEKPQEAPQSHPSHNYSYVVHDARNTLFITFILIFLNIVLYFILKTKIVMIPGVGF
jgi:hypothetical protein